MTRYYEYDIARVSPRQTAEQVVVLNSMAAHGWRVLHIERVVSTSGDYDYLLFYFERLAGSAPSEREPVEAPGF